MTSRGHRLAHFLGRHRAPICRLIARRSQLTPEEADDIFQTLCARVIATAARMHTPKAGRAWLYGVGKNLVREHLREHRKREHDPIEVANDIEETQPDPFDKLAAEDASSAKAELTIQLRNAILCLPEELRTAFVLVYLEGLSTVEAARRLGCSRTSLWSRLRRAVLEFHSSLGYGGIEGTITDKTGAAIPDVLIVLRAQRQPVSRTVRSNKRDPFRFYLLSPDEYYLRTHCPDFIDYYEALSVSPGVKIVQVQLQDAAQGRAAHQ